uniref:Uncharacterized protein n=1 Tax=Pyxicephalus adspersus TaxID=30357 RepID=A0AAV2ZI52_PYXAD|nr:TPA: hypothetical protein GDO54_005627 [Pyxicephalus adspersus]
MEGYKAGLGVGINWAPILAPRNTQGLLLMGHREYLWESELLMWAQVLVLGNGLLLEERDFLNWCFRGNTCQTQGLACRGGQYY